MKILFGWLILFLLGYSLVHLISRRISLLEKIGFAFPAGMGLNSILMFVLDLFSVPFNNSFIILGFETGIILILNVYLYTVNKKSTLISKVKSFSLKGMNFSGINLSWLVIAGFSLFVIYSIVQKALFWPPTIFDSICGYDFLGKAIAHEGTINNSLFSKDNSLYSVRTLYPPLFPINMGFAYILGHSSSQIVVALFYVSTAISFYALVKRQTSHLVAALFTMLLVFTPEFSAFSSLSSPNPPCAFYIGAGIICLYIFYKENNADYFNAGTLFIFFSLWMRQEAVVFIIPGIILIALKGFSKTNLKRIISFIALNVFILLTWRWYMKYILDIREPQRYLTQLLWNSEKFSDLCTQLMHATFSTLYFGMNVYLFLIYAIAGIYLYFKKKESPVLLLIIILSWILMVSVFYQVDTNYSDDPLHRWIMSSYKRILFYFFPLILFYCAVSPVTLIFFRRIQTE